MGDFARNVSIKRRKAKLFLEIAAKRALVIQSNYFKAKIDLLQMGEEAKYKVNIYLKSLYFISKIHCILRLIISQFLFIFIIFLWKLVVGRCVLL